MLTLRNRVKKKKKKKTLILIIDFIKIAFCEQYILLSFRSFAEIFALNSRDSKYTQIDSSDNFVKFT